MERPQEVVAGAEEDMEQDDEGTGETRRGRSSCRTSVAGTAQPLEPGRGVTGYAATHAG